jgi:hypothetical protein
MRASHVKATKERILKTELAEEYFMGQRNLNVVNVNNISLV